MCSLCKLMCILGVTTRSSEAGHRSFCLFSPGFTQNRRSGFMCWLCATTSADLTFKSFNPLTAAHAMPLKPRIKSSLLAKISAKANPDAPDSPSTWMTFATALPPPITKSLPHRKTAPATTSGSGVWPKPCPSCTRPATEEKRWADGVLARKNGLGF
jgi:hypothetical protein